MPDGLYDWYAEEKNRRWERILWAAVKYALCVEEADVVEAVVEAVWVAVPDISDETLAALLTAVEGYVKEARAFLTEGIFLPEWNDVMDCLREEYEMRKARFGNEG